MLYIKDMFLISSLSLPYTLIYSLRCHQERARVEVSEECPVMCQTWSSAVLGISLQALGPLPRGRALRLKHSIYPYYNQWWYSDSREAAESKKGRKEGRGTLQLWVLEIFLSFWHYIPLAKTLFYPVRVIKAVKDAILKNAKGSCLTATLLLLFSKWISSQ